MIKNFLKFKRRYLRLRVVRSLMIGGAFGFAVSGISLILSKLALLDYEPIFALPFGIGALLIAFGLSFILQHKSDAALAARLDSEFALQDRLKTMVELSGAEDGMSELQREDAERALGDVDIKRYRIKRIWIYILPLIVSAALLACGLIISDMRGYEPPEKLTPFKLSSLQEAGLGELIKYVDESDMQEQFRNPISEELRALLEDLRIIDTERDMIVRMSEAMSKILDITYESSSEAELLNSLWDSGDINLRYLAKTLDTSDWNSPDWGDFAEGLLEYREILIGESREGLANRLAGQIDIMQRRLDIALKSSGIDSDDLLYSAIGRLFTEPRYGFVTLMARLENMNDTEAEEALSESLDSMSGEIYEALSTVRTNALVGEYVMTRLAGLFGVPLPEFERPEFVKTGERPDGSIPEEDKDNQGSNDGGIGEGATFGSDDYVLDPISGEYVKYGELILKYYGIMSERLQGEDYSEEQKEMINKYFALLFSGIENEEGN